MKKTPKRELRLKAAKSWISTYSGQNIIKGYSKKFTVNKLCAVKELRMIGVEISDEYEKQLKSSVEALRQQRISIKQKREVKQNASCKYESDDHFAMIVGYTNGGVPFGVTHEEMEEINASDQ